MPATNENPAAVGEPRTGLIGNTLDGADFTFSLSEPQASWPARQLPADGLPESVIVPQPSREAAETFLRDQVRDAIHLVSIEPDGPGIDGRYFGEDAAEAAKWAIAENSRQRNVYWTVNVIRPGCNRKPKKGDITEARFVHVDVDPPKNGGFDRGAALLRLDLLACPPTLIVDSGNGLQALWRLERSASDWQAIEAINRGAEPALGADHCHNIDRLLRIPGTVNYPDKKKRAAGRVPVLAASVSAYEDATYAADALAKLFPPRRPDKKESEKVTLGPFDLITADDLAMPDRELIRGAIEHPKGEDRSADGFRCACLMLHAGATPEQVAGVLLNPENAVSGHYLDQANPERAVRRVIEHADAEVKMEFPPIAELPAAVAAAPADDDEIELPEVPMDDGYRVYDFGDEDDLSAIRDPLVAGFLDQGSVAIVYGKSQTGKSFVLMRMAWHVAAGEPWAGQFVTQGPVLYVATEAHEGIPKRKAALRKVLGKKPVPIRFVTLKVSLGSGGASAVKRIIKEARALERSAGSKPVLIVVDTISAAMMNVDSSAAGEASAIIARLRQIAIATGAAVCGVYHTGKNEDNGPLGSYLFTANVDSQIQVRVGEIEVQKEREDGKAPLIGFALDRVDLGFTSANQPITSMVARILDRPQTDLAATERGLRDDLRGVLQLLRSMAEKLDRSMDVVGLSLKSLAKESIARGMREGKSEKSVEDSMRKALKRLAELGLAKVHCGLWLPTETQTAYEKVMA